MEKKDTKIGFKLKGIKTEQFAVFEENYTSKKETDLSTELQFKLDYAKKQIGVFLDFEFIQSKKTFIKILISCHFTISDESWDNFENTENAQVIIPKGFLTHLAMITTGTTRGALFAKTEGTPFAKFIIPTLDLTKLIMEDALFKIPVE